MVDQSTPGPEEESDRTAALDTETPAGRADSDATQAMTPSPAPEAADRDPEAGGAGDASAAGEAADPDATELVPRDADATQIVPQGDATTVLRPAAPDETTVIPPTGGYGKLPPPGERWSGKAYVPPPGRRPRDVDDTSQWQPPEPTRAWWLPILLAIVGLIFVVGIAYAIMTAINHSHNDSPSPVTPPTQTSTPSPTPPSTSFSSPPTSTPPTTPSAVGTFTVPSTLIGLPVNEAESILDSAGIPYTAVPQPDNTTLPNIVVDTLPAPGQLLPDGGTVTLYYAQPTAASSPATPSAPASAGSGSPSQ